MERKPMAMIINNIIHRCHLFRINILIFFLLFDSYASAAKNKTSEGSQPSAIPIGVVLDVNSPMGFMADSCMKMAVADFYENHPNYATRLQLHTRNAESILDANFAVVELLKQEVVQGVIGPQRSTEDTFFAELGQNVRVPIISFASSSSATSYTDNHYFIRATPDDAVQMQALAAICKGFQWSELAILYEDTDSGSHFVSLLNKEFQKADIGLSYMVAIPNSADDKDILKELNKLATRQTRVFLVHMNLALGNRLFPLAKRAGVMSEGYAWIISNSLSIFMESMDSATHDSMEGVIGIRPYLSRSKDLESFRGRWKRNVTLSSSTGSFMELNAYGLWAYDAVTALAIAMEKINSSILNASASINVRQKNLSVSTFGPELLKKLSSIKFRGLSGDFELVDGKLKPSAFEIFNVIGSGEKTVGFWTPDRGIVRDMGTSGSTSYSTSANELKSIVWPGDSLTRPTGWAIPTSGNLRVGIPWKHGFIEFVDAIDLGDGHVNASGFSIDIFLATLEALPFRINYEFRIYNDTKDINWSYDDMLHKIPEEFDMVVGDTTNWAPRAEYVDFSLPYSESGVVLVVKNRKAFDMWIFVKPLSWDLWLAIIVACIVMGIVLLVLERRVGVASSGTDSMRAPKEKSGMVYWSPVAVLAFPERNMVSNSWSALVLVFWLFMAFILMQSYTANLSAILTVDQLKFAFSDNYYVGCQDGSFMKRFLIDQLHISASRLKSYASAEEYHEAMTLGSKNGGIDAIFDEIPYMKILLNKYDNQYKMAGPTYRTGGFGFAFPKGSSLAAHFSKAILDVTQGSNMTEIEQTNFGPGYSSQDPLSSTISQGTSSLTFHEFAGLFLVIGSVTLIALFCSETPIGRTFTTKTRQFVHNCINFRSSRINPAEDSSVTGESSEGGAEDIHESVQNNVVTSPSPPHGEVEMHEIGLSDEIPTASKFRSKN
ncbi:glutamate receptor 2.8-like [Salvia miltiorrhiza]|uniref:glutamate receptor 2.8-like n=1 Tax=Salvia miltiorrhiza TaxID=226208 RepID=UPI0025AB94B7|nr:glutamate receptor 2.8-like [Salvia miltiorrhiza]